MNEFGFFQSLPWNSAVWFRKTDKIRGSEREPGNMKLSLQLPISQSQRNSAIEENCVDTFSSTMSPSIIAGSVVQE